MSRGDRSRAPRRGLSVIEAVDRALFSKGTKGARGVCSAPGCVRNATHVDEVEVHYYYGIGLMRFARCDIHPASGVNRLTDTVAFYARERGWKRGPA